jgi:peptidoglycan/xylan/chitin deacetylase (PgdA/CDA1 family)
VERKDKMGFLISIMAVSAIGSVLYLGIPWVYGQYARLLLRKKVTRARALILTFDDGPSNRLTPAILNLLDENNAKAIFFLLGRNIAGSEEIVRWIAVQGHVICSHGFDHLHAWKVWPWQSILDIKKGWQAIDQVLGTRKGTYPFRPPNGKLNLVTLFYLWSKRVPIVYWTADIGDTWPEEKRKNRLEQEWAKLQKGAVVLAHDFDRATGKADGYVLNAVQKCLTIARENQLKVCSCTELMKAVK